ncbi:MAG: hypothetical protein AAF721_18825 [Myxococcota bacterium]
MSISFALLATVVAAGCTTPPDGEYSACAEHGMPKRCVVLLQRGGDVDIDVRVDGRSEQRMTATYTVADGYGHADTPMGELVVSLGRTIFGVGKHPTSASFEGDRAGQFNFSVLTRDHGCP